MRRGLSPAASEPLEALLPAETDVQVKTSVEAKERTPQTRPRAETWPLASPGQKVFPIPGEEGLVVKHGSRCGTQHLSVLCRSEMIAKHTV